MPRLSILFSGSFCNIYSMRSISSSDVLLSNMFNYLRYSILIDAVLIFFKFLYSSSSVCIYFYKAFLSFDLKGKKPKTIAWSMRPRDQTSILGVDFVWPLRSSGAMNRILPQLTFSILIPAIEPNIPKSTTLRSTESMMRRPFSS